MPKKKNYKECLTTPFKTGIKNFTSVANYFLYYAPNIDSAQSVGEIENPQADLLFYEMLNNSNLKGKCKVLKKIQPKSWKTLNFDEDLIDFEDSRMLFDKYNYETDFKALIRHLRNALAHGYIYVWKKKNGNFIFLIDYDSSKNKCTAKILVSMTILESWKALIEEQIAIGE
ncbi:hypothetical protein [uncultured Eubacterium sp.]|uniref:hypothetical protein n=1 Tax=uncultured Eubacterium sp. TaxID=165185 RepID=UPI00260C706F|nr:hypothetical protein [uncultured Eubacterium sp.]